MKKLIILTMLLSVTGSVFAADVFMNNNPFPQTTPETMNNIYQSEPATIQNEEKKEKKFWFRKGRNLQEQERQEAQQRANSNPNEGVINSTKDGSFYLFK